MSDADVIAVAPRSAAEQGGVAVGDRILAVNGQPLRDVIQYRLATDEAEVHLELLRRSQPLSVEIHKAAGEPLGIEVSSAVFDAVRTCDNHCAFCFIHQLPPGMRRSLSLKDDDYRLSFLYGNFTTLTRFTEADLERVLTEGLAPLFVSIHATDPDVRSSLLRNRRGGTSLRWLSALLDHGVEVHGQLVVCPGVNDGAVLADTLAGILDSYQGLADVAVVPLGVSKHNSEPEMRPHTTAEAIAVVELVETWAAVFTDVLGHRMVHAADEYYLLAGWPFPPADAYGDFGMHEDGIGMARAFEKEFRGETAGEAIGVQPGFFAWVDGAPAEGYRAPRGEPTTAMPAAELPVPSPASATRSLVSHAAQRGMNDQRTAGTAVPVQIGRTRASNPVPIGILTGQLGAQVIAPLIAAEPWDHVRVIPVENRFFGGNIGVTGLMVGEDLQRVLAAEPDGHRYLLPDVCLSGGVFLDGLSPADLPRPVEVIATDGVALRHAVMS